MTSQQQRRYLGLKKLGRHCEEYLRRLPTHAPGSFGYAEAAANEIEAETDAARVQRVLRSIEAAKRDLQELRSIAHDAKDSISGGILALTNALV